MSAGRRTRAETLEYLENAAEVQKQQIADLRGVTERFADLCTRMEIALHEAGKPKQVKLTRKGKKP